MKQSKLRRERKQPDLAETLEALQQGEGDKLTSTIFYGLSGLSAAALEQVETVWETLSTEYRRKVMRRLVDVGEANVEMNYNAFGTYALSDPDPAVRESAIELLFEDLSVGMMDRMIEMAQWDEVPRVRAAAASALGRFILAGELGNMPESETVRAQDVAASILTNEDEDVDVRRRALESIANCGHEIVDEAIEEAYAGTDRRMQVSAVYAMGRTYDERWNPIVVRELDSEDAEMRYEAARAAGELEVREAVPLLVRLAQGRDREVGEAAIWALGEIGGMDSSRALSALARRAAENGDDDLVEAIEDALVNANLVDYDLFDPDDIQH